MSRRFAHYLIGRNTDREGDVQGANSGTVERFVFEHILFFDEPSVGIVGTRIALVRYCSHMLATRASEVDAMQKKSGK